jgi:hypothetical protein
VLPITPRGKENEQDDRRRVTKVLIATSHCKDSSIFVENQAVSCESHLIQPRWANLDFQGFFVYHESLSERELGLE